MNYESNRSHAVYVVYFSDDRIKVGLTANVRKRMRYFAQEARRNRVEHLVWYACAPTRKSFARSIETHFCREMRPCAIAGHREWFIGDTSAFGAVINAIDRLREEFAENDEAVADLGFLGSSGQARVWSVQ